jgi:hypothetical protein
MEASETPEEGESSGGGSPLGGVTDNLRKALDDLRSAGEKATGDVRSSIDDAVRRINDATSDVRSQATDQVGEWTSTLDTATEDVRLQLGKLAVRAQTSRDSLKAIEKEAKARRKELKDAG